MISTALTVDGSNLLAVLLLLEDLHPLLEGVEHSRAGEELPLVVLDPGLGDVVALVAQVPADAAGGGGEVLAWGPG